MVFMKLNDVEKSILCAMCKNPYMSAKELAEFLDLNYWTVYKSINNMKKKGIFKEVVIPNFKSLGFELLVVGYGSLTKKKMDVLQKVKTLKTELPFSSGIFYSFAESYRGFVFAISKNFTEVAKGLIYAERLIHVREFLKGENTEMIILPLEITEIPLFFDYSNLICKEFNLNIEKIKEKKEKIKKLTKKDVQVLLEIVKNPETKISHIAKILNMAPQSVSKIKEKLFAQSYISKKIIPNLPILGYDVLVFAHWNSNPEVMEKMQNIKFEDLGYDMSNVVFAAYNSLEGVALAPFKSLKESRDIVSFFENFGEATGVLTKEPNILFLSLQEGIAMRDHEYYPILSSILK